MSTLTERTEIARQTKRNIPDTLMEIESLATLSREVALSCFYVVINKDNGKPFMGISVRLAELIASCWGNIHTGAKIINKTPNELTVQGFVHDFEKNTVVTVEIQRPISKLSAEQLIQATNAASSIAFRNAIFKSIPAALTSQIVTTIKEYITTNASQNDSVLSDLLSYFKSKGIGQKEIAKLLVGVPDGESIFMLTGIKNAIEEGDTTIVEVFGTGEAKPKRSSKYAFDNNNEQEESLDLPSTLKENLKNGIASLSNSAVSEEEEIESKEKPTEKESKPQKKRGRGRPRKKEKS